MGSVNRVDELEPMIELSKRRGFFWPSFSIYGGFSGLNDYGPLGTILKSRIYLEWKNSFARIGAIEIDSTDLTPEAVLKASGHADKFIDMAITCSKCKSRYKLENIIESNGGSKIPESIEEARATVSNGNFKCPKCGNLLADPYEFHLMFEIRSGNETMYLRPETAQGIFVNFKLLLNYNRGKLPMIVIQQGKGYRNEISPRQGVIRQKEFNMGEAEVFLDGQDGNSFIPGGDDIILLHDMNSQDHRMDLSSAVQSRIVGSNDHAFFMEIVYRLALKVGVDPERLRFRQHRKDELAHYSRECWDLEVKINDTWLEVAGIADRGTYDLSRHIKESGENLYYEGQKIANVIEPSIGMDRMIAASIISNMKKRENGYSYLTFPADIAPYRVAVLPLQKKDGLLEKARDIFSKIQEIEPYSVFDESGAIGRRYARQDEIGTPYCITIDYETLERDVITIRERNSTLQIRDVKVETLLEFPLFLKNPALKKFGSEQPGQ